MAATALVKYIFLDIVKFTVDRSVEAQTDIINALNKCVQETIEKNRISKKKRIFIPTGDGVCIALVDSREPYDIHLVIALDLLRSISEYNGTIEDVSRQFQVRIGINENVDNLVVDVNGRANVAGEGVNRAQRIMNVGDGGCVMVSQVVFDTLRVREKYVGAFHVFEPKDKHGQSFSVHQFIKQGYPGLATERPALFQPKVVVPEKLSPLCAYYMAIAQKNRGWIDTIDLRSMKEYTVKILLYLLATDALANSKASRTSPLSAITWNAGNNPTLDEQLKYYETLDQQIKVLCASRIVGDGFGAARSYFEEGAFILPNERGLQKLANEYPDVYQEYCVA